MTKRSKLFLTSDAFVWFQSFLEKKSKELFVSYHGKIQHKFFKLINFLQEKRLLWKLNVLSVFNLNHGGKLIDVTPLQVRTQTGITTESLEILGGYEKATSSLQTREIRWALSDMDRMAQSGKNSILSYF